MARVVLDIVCTSAMKVPWRNPAAGFSFRVLALQAFVAVAEISLPAVPLHSAARAGGLRTRREVPVRRRTEPPTAGAGVSTFEVTGLAPLGEPDSASVVPAAPRWHAAFEGDAPPPAVASELERRVRLMPHAGRSAASKPP